jgi:predicted ATPase
LEENAQYKQALSDIAEIQRPLLDSLSEQISETMRQFLPNIREFSIQIGEQDRSFALSGIAEIFLNDGATTPLAFKGDGVQSLAAIALMRHTSQSSHQDRDVLIALEEPESHLHPNAIRQLRDVLSELSTRHQVVLTTHNAIFTNRRNVSQNIIVQKNRAYPASSVKEVRDILGIRLDDNLSML